MTVKAFLDLETWSETPLKHGVHRYAEKAEVLLFAYAEDDGPVSVWDVTIGAPMPPDLKSLIERADEYWWQNGGQFDRTVLKHAMPVVHAAMPLTKWRDTMVQALAHGLPGSLSRLCEVCGIAEDLAKLKTGKALINLFCKPRPIKETLRRATRETHPAEWAEFLEYAKSDILSMREVHRKLPKWNYPNNKRELDLWHLDLSINDRGVYVDVELAEGALRAIDKAQKDLAERTDANTYGDVDKATRRDEMLRHIVQSYGITLPDLSKSTIERRLNDPDLPVALKELLAIRLEASMTSTSKYKVLLNGVSADHRLRGLLQFCGAARTGRWAGRLFQPQSLPRTNVGLIAEEMGAKPTDEVIQQYLDDGVESLKGDYADAVYSNVMGLSANLVRGCIAAPKGKKLCVADLANIEGRVAAWLAGEDWKIKAFRDYDAGTGADLYKVAYARSFGVDVATVDKEQRQLGKVQELALGYAGGVGAFVTMAMTYRMELKQVSEAVFRVIDTLPRQIVDDAHGFWDWAVKQDRTLGLEHDVFVACEILKRGWRAAHPAISSYWKEIEETLRDAIGMPGTTFKCRRLKIRRDGAWLRIQTPSGRHLCYFMPEVGESGEISYQGVNPYTRNWERVKTYGGKGFENLCQFVARDVLAHNMPVLEAEGYPIILGVHDELLTEPDDTDEFNHDRVSEIMSTVPPWAEGLPLAAEGFTAYRYRK